MCIVLGQAGVGKTSLKCLLLDQWPPDVRSSTICAETPVRIMLRKVSQTRMQNLKGRWKEVNDDKLLDTVAKMILIAEPDATLFLSESNAAKFTDEPDAAQASTAKKSSKKPEQNFLLKIVNWIRNWNKEEAKTLPAAGVRDDSAPTHLEKVAKAASTLQTSEACQRALKKIMDKLVERISKLRLEGENGQLVTFTNLGEQLRSMWIYFSDCG